MTPIIETFALGPWQTNCYLVYDAAKKGCWVADVPFEPEPLIARIRSLGLTPEAVVLTHAHVDHIGGVAEFVRAFPEATVWIHEAEEAWLNDPLLNLSEAAGIPVTAPGRTGRWVGATYLIWPARCGGAAHARTRPEDALVHKRSRRAITGDTLFVGSIAARPARAPTSRRLAVDPKQLFTLPDDLTFYPGHGPSGTIGQRR